MMPETGANAIVNSASMSWACACGKRAWNHYEACPDCGKAKPAPPPEPAVKSDLTRAEIMEATVLDFYGYPRETVT